MKTYKIFFIALILSITGNTSAQTALVGPINTYNVSSTPTIASKMVRMELINTKKYSVLDEFDMKELADSSDYSDCFSKTCLVQFGKALDADLVISGSIDKIGEKIMISLKMIDVNSGTLQKTVSDQFKNDEVELQRMIQIMVQQLLGMNYDLDLYNRLKFNSEVITSNNYGRINNSGPRMGVALGHGIVEEFMTRPKDQGGLDMFPLMSNLGYQFETQYVGTEKFSALFEFIPSLNGLEQGKFIPTFTLLNGFRFGKAGWEFAFGPTFGLKKTSFGFFDHNGVYGEYGKYYRQGDIGNGTTDEIEAEGYFVEEHLDARGDLKFSTRWVVAFGRTFRTGALNIPVNAYWSTTRGGGIVGLSAGFNITRSKKRINK